MLSRKDWLLVLLGSEGDHARPPALDRVRVMKCLFVISKNLSAHVGADFYKFQAYDYGPFDKVVYSDAETLCADGLAQQFRDRYVAYAATDAGVARANELAKRLPNDVLQYVHKVRAWAAGVDFNTLIRAIYQQWPETKVNSVFRD